MFAFFGDMRVKNKASKTVIHINDNGEVKEKRGKNTRILKQQKMKFLMITEM